MGGRGTRILWEQCDDVAGKHFDRVISARRSARVWRTRALEWRYDNRTDAVGRRVSVRFAGSSSFADVLGALRRPRCSACGFCGGGNGPTEGPPKTTASTARENPRHRAITSGRFEAQYRENGCRKNHNAVHANVECWLLGMLTDTRVDDGRRIHAAAERAPEPIPIAGIGIDGPTWR